jgi:hypothetical protein
MTLHELLFLRVEFEAMKALSQSSLELCLVQLDLRWRLKFIWTTETAIIANAADCVSSQRFDNPHLEAIFVSNRCDHILPAQRRTCPRN